MRPVEQGSFSQPARTRPWLTNIENRPPADGGELPRHRWVGQPLDVASRLPRRLSRAPRKEACPSLAELLDLVLDGFDRVLDHGLGHVLEDLLGPLGATSINYAGTDASRSSRL